MSDYDENGDTFHIDDDDDADYDDDDDHVDGTRK